MTEEFLQYIWNYNLFDKKPVRAFTGEKIEVLTTGEHNKDAGPDFFNAKIKIDDTTWVGNVEIHLKSSDWLKHKHDKDKAYDNVILHVVLVNDAETTRTNDEIITTVRLSFDKKLFAHYQILLQSQLWIPCENDFHKIDKFIVAHWLNNLLVERLENKSDYILQNLSLNKNNWENTFYQQLARNFGFKLNAEPFELLAKSLPVVYLAKHKNNLLQIEALLFGQSGLLNDNFSDDEYFQSLKKEYKFLRHKFNLKPVDKHLWKFLRLRPSNFPTLRISQFATLIYKSTALFSKIIEVNGIKELNKLFKISASEYWDTHYVFNKESKKKKKILGKTAFNIIVINTIVPFLFVYGKSKDNEVYKNKAIKLLEELKPEKNSIINNWEKTGVKAINSFYSQALLQLKNEYCAKKKCLKCQIGNKIIAGLGD